MTLRQIVENKLRQTLASKSELSNNDLNNLLRLLAKWRHTLITNTLIAQQGNVVQTGPFAGLRFVGQTSEGCSAPRLLGCYEHELHPHLERLIGQSFDTVLNICELSASWSHFVSGIKAPVDCRHKGTTLFPA